LAHVVLSLAYSNLLGLKGLVVVEVDWMCTVNSLLG
jgi:hypothetical protein